MDIIIGFDVKDEEGITKGLLAGHSPGCNYKAIISSNRLACVNLEKEFLVGNLLGVGEGVYGVGVNNPDILIHSIDLFTLPVFVTNH